MDMSKILNPTMVAGTIAGGTIGAGFGFLKEGEESEARGDLFWGQVLSSARGLVNYGVVGAGIGLGTSTALVLKNVLSSRL